MTMYEICRVRRSGSFQLDLDAGDAFPLFTAEGERDWVPGWSPTVLGPKQEAGLVFLTGTGKENTIWTVLESDRAQLRHRYSQVTPGVRAGTVEVSLSREAAGCCVHVAYDMTALPGASEDALDGYCEPNFDAMLREWRELIGGLLRRRSVECGGARA